jgi:hypothetical protein
MVQTAPRILPDAITSVDVPEAAVWADFYDPLIEDRPAFKNGKCDHCCNLKKGPHRGQDSMWPQGCTAGKRHL